MSGFLLLLMEFRPKAVEDTAPPKVAVASIAGRVQEAAIPGYPGHPGLHNVTAVTIDWSSQSIEYKLTNRHVSASRGSAKFRCPDLSNQGI